MSIDNIRGSHATPDALSMHLTTQHPQHHRDALKAHASVPTGLTSFLVLGTQTVKVCHSHVSFHEPGKAGPSLSW